MKITKKDGKELFNFIKEYDLDADDARGFVNNIIDGNNDFVINDIRFINTNAIDKIQQDELKSDLYILGYFNNWFLADILGIDVDVIDAMQEAEAFEAIGKLIISMGKLEELQEEYASADGYGHHFNSYDFSEDELHLLHLSCVSYHVFNCRG